MKIDVAQPQSPIQPSHEFATKQPVGERLQQDPRFHLNPDVFELPDQSAAGAIDRLKQREAARTRRPGTQRRAPVVQGRPP
jgi:hypothetical protein